MSANRVRDEPKIVIGHDNDNDQAPTSTNTHGTTSTPSPTTPTQYEGHFFDHGDLLVQGLWDKNTACALDIRVMDTDQPSYRGSTPEQVIAAQERSKKALYIERCHENRRHFTPYVCYVSGILGKETKEYNKRLAALLAKKWQSPYPVTCGYVDASKSITILRATHLYIRGSRVPLRYMCSKQSQ